jgi:hypothetical protein
MTPQSLDHPRRCLMCGSKISECMGHVLARDILPVMRAIMAGQPIPLIKVRELCGRCEPVWGQIAANVDSDTA